MPDLDAIHYKFFPKAKTAPWGKKLIVMAWIIEILVASVSFAIAMIFFLSGGDSNLKVAQLAGFVAEKSNYHHGEVCLFDTITKMAPPIDLISGNQ